MDITNCNICLKMRSFIKEHRKRASEIQGMESSFWKDGGDFMRMQCLSWALEVKYNFQTHKVG